MTNASQNITLTLTLPQLARLHVACTIAKHACERSERANRLRGKDAVANAEQAEARIFSALTTIIDEATNSK